jgi:hypothetical protein
MLSVEKNYGVMSGKSTVDRLMKLLFCLSSHLLNMEARSQWKNIETAIESSVKTALLLSGAEVLPMHSILRTGSISLSHPLH